MKNRTESANATDNDGFQNRLLAGVSRTFALTIPQLPAGLRRAVTNAYLLCRIADTIEDDPAVYAEQKDYFHRWLVDILMGHDDARAFAWELSAILSKDSSPEEKSLVAQADRVIEVTRGLAPAMQDILSHRISIMCRGMPQFQRRPLPYGLHNLGVMNQYCYYVAGVVGQMLTELFCQHSAAMARRRSDLLGLSASFGQGLQMTNILKDVWEDHRRGACWLPRDVFAVNGYDLHRLHPDRNRDAFSNGLTDLIAVAHGHLRNAMSYTLMIPGRQSGIRRFCLWSLVLAVLTLRSIQDNPYYRCGAQVKVSRRTVWRTLWLTGLACRSAPLIRVVFSAASHGLPLASEVSTYSPGEYQGRPWNSLAS